MRYARAAVATILTTVVVLATAVSPAVADPGMACDPGEVCLYADYNYTGAWVDFDQSRWNAPNQHYCQTMAAFGLNNVTSSVRNRTSINIAISDSGRCTGSAVIVLPGQSLPNLGTCCAYNDRVSGVTRY